MAQSAPAESQDPDASDAAAAAGVLDTLSPPNLDRLAGAVYRLMRDDLIRQRERRGASLDRWR